jgi:hypothetical protein
MPAQTMTRDEQLDYLREVSPEAASAYDAHTDEVKLSKADDLDGRLADSLIALEATAADPSVDPLVRETARKAARRMQAKRLLSTNPRSAAAWAQAQVGSAA